jgi:hypothetical protein
MTAIEVRDLSVHEDHFLQQTVAHHRNGDHYPDPWVIGKELRLSRTQTEAVMQSLRAIGWVAASPYGPERLRLTPRCWDSLSRAAQRQPVGAQNAA